MSTCSVQAVGYTKYSHLVKQRWAELYPLEESGPVSWSGFANHVGRRDQAFGQQGTREMAVATAPRARRKCESGDSNPDPCSGLDPKSSASANSATLAGVVRQRLASIGLPPRVGHEESGISAVAGLFDNHAQF